MGDTWYSFCMSELSTIMTASGSLQTSMSDKGATALENPVKTFLSVQRFTSTLDVQGAVTSACAEVPEASVQWSLYSP